MAGNARVRVEFELARLQNALAATEKARRKAEDKVSRLIDEQVSLLLELGTCKNEISTILVEARRESEALRKAWT